MCAVCAKEKKVKLQKEREFMKREKCFLVICILIGILSVQATAGTKMPLPRENKPWLIGKPYFVLSRIDSLLVTIEPSDSTTNKQDPLWKNLAEKIEKKLKDTGVKIGKIAAADRHNGIAQLKIQIETLELEDSKQSFFYVRTSLSRKVYLELTDQDSSDLLLKSILLADVWKKTSPIQQVASRDALAKITELALKQTDAFAAAWLVANPPGKKPPVANYITITKKEPIKPVVKPATIEYKYVASKNSKVFHNAECRSARVITEKNLVYYKNRNEAINAGKRSCKICRP